jgi:hypothetical protein
VIKGMSDDEVERQVRLYDACLENRRQELWEELRMLHPDSYQKMLKEIVK